MNQVERSLQVHPYARPLPTSTSGEAIPFQYLPPSQTHHHIDVAVVPEEEDEELNEPMTEKQLINSVNKELVGFYVIHIRSISD
jgi:hypothetical protein